MSLDVSPSLHLLLLIVSTIVVALVRWMITRPGKPLPHRTRMPECHLRMGLCDRWRPPGRTDSIGVAYPGGFINAPQGVRQAAVNAPPVQSRISDCMDASCVHRLHVDNAVATTVTLFYQYHQSVCLESSQLRADRVPHLISNLGAQQRAVHLVEATRIHVRTSPSHPAR